LTRRMLASTSQTSPVCRLLRAMTFLLTRNSRVAPSASGSIAWREGEPSPQTARYLLAPDQAPWAHPLRLTGEEISFAFVTGLVISALMVWGVSLLRRTRSREEPVATTTSPPVALTCCSLTPWSGSEI